MAYEVLGDLVAKVSGMSFEDHVRETILSPIRHEVEHAAVETGGPCQTRDRAHKSQGRQRNPDCPLPVQPRSHTELQPALERQGYGSMDNAEPESR